MSISKTKVFQVFNTLQEHNVYSYFNDLTHLYFDEAPIHCFSTEVNKNSPYFKNQHVSHLNFVAGGSSFSSKLEALSKCIGEFLERLSLSQFQKNELITGTFNELQNKYVIPAVFINDDIKNVEFVWCKVNDYINNSEVLIPAEYVYIMHFLNSDKFPIEPSSNGAAGGFNREQALLGAILERVERDAFFTIYLNKIKPPKIKVNSIHYKKVRDLIQRYKSYYYDIALFDITNDLNVPTYATFLYDLTNTVNVCAIGTKSDFEIEKAIVGSLEEALKIRLLYRGKIIQPGFYSATLPTQITTLDDRIRFWLQPEIIKELNYFTNQPEVPLKRKYKKLTVQESLNVIKKVLKDKGYSLYVVDVSNKLSKSVGYTVYKSVIPNLQPLYFYESERFFNRTRLQQVSQFFGQKKFTINTLPHPFI